jgi:hypothetical protein
MLCFNGQSLVKMENNFCKKLGSHLIKAKGQTHPGASEIGMSLCKIKKITLMVCAMKQELIYISQVVYYLWGVLCPAFRKSFW